MIAHVIFKQLNPDYDKEYAIEYHGGKESENNRKIMYEMASANSLSDFTGHTVKKNEVLETNFGKIPGMTLIEGSSTSKGTILLAAISSSLVKKIHAPVNKQYGIMRIYIYIHETADFFEDGMYVYDKDPRK